MANDKTKVKKFSRNYSKITLKILFGKSGNECVEPSCSNRIIEDETEESDAAVIAQISHIYALSDDGPRGKPGLTERERNHYRNLLLLCPTHHTVVDKQHETYPAEMVQAWKKSHELKFSNNLAAQISDIGYAELEIAAKAVMVTKADPNGVPNPPLPPQDKIYKNELGEDTAEMIKMGAAKSHDVAIVIVQAAQLNPAFPDLLRKGFQEKYAVLRSEGLRGDDLFDALYVWAGGHSSKPKRHAAGLCILTHLFILCDVFES